MILASLALVVAMSEETAAEGLGARSPITSPAQAIRAAGAAKAAKDDASAERVLREACETWPDDLELRSHLAAFLYVRGRLDESIPMLRRVCEEGRFEPACAVSLGIDLVRGRWLQAFAAASQFSESACYRSSRLWTLKLLAVGSLGAVAAAERLVRAQPDKETSYLFLAAALWRSGARGEAERALTQGRERATQVVLLRETMAWAKDR